MTLSGHARRAGLSEFTDVDARRASEMPDALREMFEGDRQGLVLRGLFEPSFMEDVVQRLEQHDPPFTKTSFPAPFGAYLYGQGLDLAEERLDEYYREAVKFREHCRALFEGGPDFEETIVSLLSQMSGGRLVQVPRVGVDRVCTPATIRILPRGGYIRTHCGNECMIRPAYRELREVLDTTEQLSFFVTLAEPESGGELVVYDMQWEHLDPAMMEHGHSDVDDVVHRYEHIRLHPHAGDVIIFDGGRYFHRVTSVEGSTTRWTIGGFVGFSRDGGLVYYWS